MNAILNVVAAIGRGVIASCRSAGAFAIFAAEGLVNIVLPPFYPRLIGRAMFAMGFLSLPVVALTAIFAGMVIALQSYTGFARYAAQSQTASIVVLSVTRELGPVLAALMMAGRAGAAMAAELGTMRVTDQIDALQTLSTKPMKYLVAPRLLAGIVAMPLLVIVADILGVLGGFIVCTVKLGFNGPSYIQDSFVGVEDAGCDTRPRQGRGLRLRHRALGLLPRLSQPRRRRRGGLGHHLGRGHGLGAGPRA